MPMSEDNTKQNADPSSEPEKLGEYLAYQREKNGLSVEEVARKLYLSAHVVRSLEGGLYEKLPEPVYVRGYIRGYCRILSLDPKPLLEMYAQALPQKIDPMLEDLSIISPVNERQQRLTRIWGSVAVVAVLVALMFGWLNENKVLNGDDDPLADNTPPLVEPADSSDELPPAQPTPPLQPSNLAEETPPAQPTPPLESPSLIEATPSADPTSPVEPTSLLEVSGLTEETPLAATTPAVVPLTPVEAPPTIEPTVTDSGTPFGDDANADTAALDVTADAPASTTDDDSLLTAITPPPVTLAIMTSRESWTKVIDGTGVTIVERILPPGYSKIFMVNLPLNFRFGNARSVDIMIDGADYDFSSSISANEVASFEVTELP